MRTLYLVRHAMAQDRATWTLDDGLRPLTSSGWAQAAEIAARLGDGSLATLVSSPTTRCRDTLIPLAHRLALPILDERLLLEQEAPLTPEKARGLLHQLLEIHLPAGCLAAACSHGDVLPALVRAAGYQGSPPCPKGCVWRLELEDESPSGGELSYLGRPLPQGGWGR